MQNMVSDGFNSVNLLQLSTPFRLLAIVAKPYENCLSGGQLVKVWDKEGKLEFGLKWRGIWPLAVVLYSHLGRKTLFQRPSPEMK